MREPAFLRPVPDPSPRKPPDSGDHPPAAQTPDVLALRSRIISLRAAGLSYPQIGSMVGLEAAEAAQGR